MKRVFNFYVLVFSGPSQFRHFFLRGVFLGHMSDPDGLGEGWVGSFHERDEGEWLGGTHELLRFVVLVGRIRNMPSNEIGEML